MNGGNYGLAGGASGTGSAANTGSFGARAAEIYDPRAAVGQRYSGLLANSGLDRLYHSNAFLTINGDVTAPGMRTSFDVQSSALSQSPCSAVSRVQSQMLDVHHAVLAHC